MRRLGLICNFLPATLFLAAAAFGGTTGRAQDLDAEVLKALPPKPVAHAAPTAPAPARLPEVATSAVVADKTTAAAGGAAEAQPVRARILEMFDKNKNGRLDADERAAARKYAEQHGFRPGAIREQMAKNGGPAATMRTELLQRFDRNANGRIDDDEMPALEQAMRARLGSAPALRQRYDTNHDGKIDDEEWKAARGQIQEWLNESARAK